MSPRTRTARGAALIEVMIAVIILSLALLSVFAVAVAGRRSEAEVEMHAAAGRARAALLDALALYVTADATAATASFAPNGSWRYPPDTSNAPWALQPGDHAVDAAGFDKEFADRGGRLSYTVANPAAGQETTAVTVTASW